MSPSILVAAHNDYKCVHDENLKSSYLEVSYLHSTYSHFFAKGTTVIGGEHMILDSYFSSFSVTHLS